MNPKTKWIEEAFMEPYYPGIDAWLNSLENEKGYRVCGLHLATIQSHYILAVVKVETQEANDES